MIRTTKNVEIAMALTHGGVFHADEGRNVDMAIDSVWGGIDTIIILAGANTLANELKAELLL